MVQYCRSLSKCIQLNNYQDKYPVSRLESEDSATSPRTLGMGEYGSGQTRRDGCRASSHWDRHRVFDTQRPSIPPVGVLRISNSLASVVFD